MWCDGRIITCRLLPGMLKIIKIFNIFTKITYYVIYNLKNSYNIMVEISHFTNDIIFFRI